MPNDYSEIIDSTSSVFNLFIEHPFLATLFTITIIAVLIIVLSLRKASSEHTKDIKAWLYRLLQIKAKTVVFSSSDVKQCNCKEALSQYFSNGISIYQLELRKAGKKIVFTSKENTRKIIERYSSRREKEILQAFKQTKANGNFIYIGFPNIPYAFLDGYTFKNIRHVKLFEYNDGRYTDKERGFFELTNVQAGKRLVDISSEVPSSNIVVIAVEQTYSISDDDIAKTIPNPTIVRFKIKYPVYYYNDIEIITQKFKELINTLQKNGTDEIHIFATISTSVAFSLGRETQHFHPDIIVYNYSNNKFEWGLNIKTKKLVYQIV